MAMEKGTKVNTVEKRAFVLKVRKPGAAAEEVFAEADSADETQASWIRDLYLKVGQDASFTLYERVTKVRTSVVEREVVMDEVRHR